MRWVRLKVGSGQGDELAGIGAECGGVTRGEVWISWIGTGVDQIVSGNRSGRMRHMLCQAWRRARRKVVTSKFSPTSMTCFGVDGVDATGLTGYRGLVGEVLSPASYFQLPGCAVPGAA